jgi:D-tagatose-1,6-bisphosphate aldolase subunit GatZ/KbaZ
MNDPIRNMISKRKSGIMCGVVSFCTANELVIEAIFEQANKSDDFVLIEATANQVNQFGGYTGMQPIDFKEFVHNIAERINFPKDKIILGGDHLGPLLWTNDPEEAAMEKAIDLVKLFVQAGYKKIHLDTSMRLADDPKDVVLSDETIARRAAILYQVCEETYQEMLSHNPREARPVYIIGSEVPIPGGTQEAEESISVTKPESVDKTLSIYKQEFDKLGFDNAFDNIIGLVVQPGVEFGDSEIHHYNSYKAAKLCDCITKYDGIVYEGHSTDYQTPKNLRKMVEDGIAILKVGPALTFALREGLFSLSKLEQELVPKQDRANFMEVLETVMQNDTDYWKKHYHGTTKQLLIKRRYSFSDRCRYYLTRAEIVDCIHKLFDNLDNIDIPLSMLRQYMPLQYIKVRDGKLKMNARDLAKDYVAVLIEDYNYAIKPNHIIGAVLV